MIPTVLNTPMLSNANYLLTARLHGDAVKSGGRTLTAGNQGPRDRNGPGGYHAGPEFRLYYFKFLHKEYITCILVITLPFKLQ